MVNDSHWNVIRCHHELLHSLIEGMMQLENEVLIRNWAIWPLRVEITTIDSTSAAHRNVRQKLQSIRDFVFNTVVSDNINDLRKIWLNILTYVVKLSQIICVTSMCFNVFHSLLVLNPVLTSKLRSVYWFFILHKHPTIKRPEYEIRVTISEMLDSEVFQLKF